MQRGIPEAANPEREAYWLNLGRFISWYGLVEWQINRLVRRYYRIGLARSNIILGQLRYDNAVDHLNRLRIAGRISDDDARHINIVKDQLGKITRLRNASSLFRVGRITRR
jgi:hypothetical protein